MFDYQKYVTNDRTNDNSRMCKSGIEVSYTVYYIDCFEPINLIFSFICIVCVYFFIAH